MKASYQSYFKYKEVIKCLCLTQSQKTLEFSDAISNFSDGYVIMVMQGYGYVLFLPKNLQYLTNLHYWNFGSRFWEVASFVYPKN